MVPRREGRKRPIAARRRQSGGSPRREATHKVQAASGTGLREGIRMRVAMMAALAGAIGFAGPVFALDKVTFGTNWVADPEAGGYYQAVADGTYEKYGLDVTVLQGGPQSNGGMLLLAGKIEFFMGGDMLGDFLSVEQNIPTIAVAADFQKDPQVFMSHPGAGFDKWTDLPKATAFVSAGGTNSFYAWMRLAWGFKDENVKPYNFNSAPFIADKNSDR